jgi:ribosomal protein S18 acetylase RimI-like enzyme
VTLNVRVENVAARAAYETNGFAFVRAKGDEHVLKRSLL